MVDIKGVPENKLCVVCFPGEQDTTFIRLSVAMPSYEKSKSVDISNASVKVHCGSECSVDKASWKGPGYYYSVFPYQAGETVSVFAHIDGVCAVNAESTFPPIPNMTVDTYENGSKMVLRIIIQNVQSKDEKYGLRISQRERFVSDVSLHNGQDCFRKEILKDELIDWTFPDEKSINIFDEMESGRMSCYVNDEEMTIFTSKDVENGKICLEIPVWHQQDYVTNYFESGEEEYLSTYRYYYKIDLFSISDEMYYFFENKSLAGNNILGNIGLAPVYFRKENVSGGFGVLGCCSRATSGWLPNLNPMPDYNDLEDGKRLIHDWLADFMHQAQ